MSELSPRLTSTLEFAFHPTANENEAMNAFRAGLRMMRAAGKTFTDIRTTNPEPLSFSSSDSTAVVSRRMREEIQSLKQSEAALRREIDNARYEIEASRREVVALREQTQRLQQHVEERDEMIERLTAHSATVQKICETLNARCGELTARATEHADALREKTDALREARTGEASARVALIQQRRNLPRGVSWACFSALMGQSTAKRASEVAAAYRRISGVSEDVILGWRQSDFVPEFALRQTPERLAA